MLKLPGDVARCANEKCVLRNTCLRFLSPPYERQVFILHTDPDGCEEYIEMDQETIR